MSQVLNYRMDILSRKPYPSASLFRFVVIEGKLQLDEGKNLKGRGFYLLKDLSSIEEAKKKNLLARVSKTQVEASFYTDLKEHL